MDTLLSFMERLIELEGGAVERQNGEEVLQALLPGDLQQRLGLGEVAAVRAGGPGEEEGDGARIGHGTELLERAVSRAIERGRTASVRMPDPGSEREVLSRLESCLGVLNASYRVEGVQAGLRDYWLWSFTAAVEADERREEPCRVCISSGGVECPDLVEPVLERVGDWEEIPVPPGAATKKRLGDLYPVAADRALRRLSPVLRRHARGVARRHGRDIQLTRAYFGALRMEMEEEIERRGIEGEALQVRREKQAQLSGEEERKLAALAEKYRLRVVLRPRSLLLARLPVRRCDVLVRRRKGQRRIAVVFNLLSGRFDELACEACGSEILEVGFCDDELHLLCRSCLSGDGSHGGKRCPRCRGQRPPTSPEKVVERLGLRDGWLQP